MKKIVRGFGLIELMVAMTLGLVVVLGITQIFLAARMTFATQNASARMQEDARFVLSKMIQEIRMVGMFGCLSTSAITDAPADFNTPIAWSSGTGTRVLTFITADVGNNGGTPDWKVVSDCKSSARAYTGSQSPALVAGQTVFPLRKLIYTFENNQLKIGSSKAVLVDHVSAFTVTFGVANSASTTPVVSYDSSPGNLATIRSVRLALTLQDPDGQVRDQVYSVVASLRNRLE